MQKEEKVVSYSTGEKEKKRVHLSELPKKVQAACRVVHGHSKSKVYGGRVGRLMPRS